MLKVASVSVIPLAGYLLFRNRVPPPPHPTLVLRLKCDKNIPRDLAEEFHHPDLKLTYVFHNEITVFATCDNEVVDQSVYVGQGCVISENETQPNGIERALKDYLEFYGLEIKSRKLTFTCRTYRYLVKIFNGYIGAAKYRFLKEHAPELIQENKSLTDALIEFESRENAPLFSDVSDEYRLGVVIINTTSGTTCDSVNTATSCTKQSYTGTSLYEMIRRPTAAFRRFWR